MTHYCPAAGLPEVRKTVAEYFSKTRGADVAVENVVIMPGAKPLIFNVIFSLVNPGDEVIYPNPGYPIYESVIEYCGGKAVPMHLKEDVGFRFSVDDLRALVTPKTQLIIVNSPQNPTGGILTTKDLEAIYALAEEHDLWVMTDEIYSRIVYE